MNLISTFKKILGIHEHEWTQWEVFDGNKFTGTYGEVKVVVQQRRFCKTCNKMELDVIKKDV